MRTASISELISKTDAPKQHHNYKGLLAPWDVQFEVHKSLCNVSSHDSHPAEYHKSRVNTFAPASQEAIGTLELHGRERKARQEAASGKSSGRGVEPGNGKVGPKNVEERGVYGLWLAPELHVGKSCTDGGHSSTNPVARPQSLTRRAHKWASGVVNRAMSV